MGGKTPDMDEWNDFGASVQKTDCQVVHCRFQNMHQSGSWVQWSWTTCSLRKQPDDEYDSVKIDFAQG